MKLDVLYEKSSEQMDEVDDESVHLVITSPPYNVGKEYERDMTFAEWFFLLKNVFKECRRVLVKGGRIAINVANINRKPMIPLDYYIEKIMFNLGFLMRGKIIWWKGTSGGTSTAWGSWKSASDPILRDEQEYILIFSKDKFKLEGEISTISDSEFVQFTRCIWKFNTTSAKKVGHPAPFPEELPRRVMQLYSFKENLILDPFVGSGTTALVALKNDRHYIGYDIVSDYIHLARRRIWDFKCQWKLTDFL